jgi:hypothetical protein
VTPGCVVCLKAPGRAGCGHVQLVVYPSSVGRQQFLLYSLSGFFHPGSGSETSVRGPHHFYPAFHFDADPDSIFHSYAEPDPDPTFQFDADPAPEPTNHFFPDLDPPMLENDSLTSSTLMRIPAFHFDADPDHEVF